MNPLLPLPLQSGLPAVESGLVRAALRLVAFGVGATVVVGGVALVYRWYTRLRLPVGLAALVGLSVVALYLNTVGVFTDLLSGKTGVFAPASVAFNVAALGLGAVGGSVGRLVGDRVATDVFAVAGARELDVEMSRIARSVGRITAVTLPDDADDIGDIDGYDPVADDVKASLVDKTLLFPRRLTVAELQDRLVTRLRDDYGIGHVDVDLDADGTVRYLAVGSRATGVGPTLAPGAVAVAVEADPANAASPGDLVQVWRTDPAPERVLTAELRAHVDDVATLAVDEEEASKLDAQATYRLVTLPADPRTDREFASLLRAADETMFVVEVAEGGDLSGTAVGDLDVTVAAVRPATGSVDTLPSRGRALAPGDQVYVVGRPEAFRRLDARSRPEATAETETQSS
ncbi:MAG: potassium transporter TrkA [Haloplanus sp.]